jgi:CRP-like cAMP-binding protein
VRCKTVKRGRQAHSGEHSVADLVTPADNLLIDSLPPAVRTRLLAVCEPVALLPHAILCEQGQRSRAAYFPTDGAISLMTVVAGESNVEVARLGPEGMLGAHLALGISESPLRAVVCYPGSAWRLTSVALRRELNRGSALQRCCRRYLYLLTCQQATSVACERLHTIGARLARLLLMLCDRTRTRPLLVTHESLALTLGARRVSVTMAAGHLSRDGLITYHRGELQVLDRPGLESVACSCYAADRLEQQRWMPDPRAGTEVDLVPGSSMRRPPQRRST